LFIDPERRELFISGWKCDQKVQQYIGVACSGCGPVKVCDIQITKTAAGYEMESIGTQDMGMDALGMGIYEGFLDRVLDRAGYCIYAWDHLDPRHKFIAADKVRGKSMRKIEHEYLPKKERPNLTGMAQEAMLSGQVKRKTYSLMGLKRLALAYPLGKGLALVRLWSMRQAEFLKTGTFHGIAVAALML
jgi:hypothetical protein